MSITIPKRTHKKGDLLHLCDNPPERFQAIIKESKLSHVRGLIIGPIFYSKNNLEDLSHFSHIEELSFESDQIEDFEGLKELKNLKSLHISENVKRVINISHLQSLEFIRSSIKNIESFEGLNNLKSIQLIDAKNNLKELDKCKQLKDLSLIGYKPKKKSLDLFYNENLESLTIWDSNIEELNLKTNCPNLRRLKLINCKKVKTIESITRLKFLKDLRIDGCTGIMDYHRLSSFKFDSFTLILGGKNYEQSELHDLKANTKLVDLLQCMPTIKWRERMSDGDLIFTSKKILSTQKILSEIIQTLESSKAHANVDKVLPVIENGIKKLNKLNEKENYFIDSMEREELVEFINEIYIKSGCEYISDVTERLRTW